MTTRSEGPRGRGMLPFNHNHNHNRPPFRSLPKSKKKRLRKRRKRKNQNPKTETSKNYVLSRIYSDIDMDQYMTPIAWAAIRRLYNDQFEVKYITN